MRQEVRDEWVAALRSGDYKQGTGALRTTEDDGDQYCCLGVLCELAVKHQVIPAAELDGNLWTYGQGDDTSEAYLPDAVQQWAGVERRGVLELPGVRFVSLADENDRGKRFDQIADLIDQSVERTSA